MLSDWHAMLWFALVITSLFVTLTMAGLILSRRMRAGHLRDTNAAFVRGEFGDAATAGQMLLYGIWQTSTTAVVLVVRDQHDRDVGKIVRDPSGTVITTASTSYRVIAMPGMTEHAELIALPDGSAAPVGILCRFHASGSFGNQVGCYELADGTVLSMRSRWSWPWQHAPLPITRDNHTVGHCTALGKVVARGVAISLPPSVSLPVGLFMLCKRAGTPWRAASH